MKALEWRSISKNNLRLSKSYRIHITFEWVNLFVYDNSEMTIFKINSADIGLSVCNSLECTLQVTKYIMYLHRYHSHICVMSFWDFCLTLHRITTYFIWICIYLQLVTDILKFCIATIVENFEIWHSKSPTFLLSDIKVWSFVCGKY